MANQLFFEVEAEHELAEAAQRYEAHRPGLGQQFLDEVAATGERVRQFPRAGAPVKAALPTL